MNDKERWVLEWFEKGDQDLKAAKGLINLEDSLFNIVCFHAQQCVEKYLKGFLSFHDIEVRRTHDLVELLVECSKIDLSFLKWKDFCESLTDYAFEPRYPDNFKKYSLEEASEAISFASFIRGFVKGKVKLSEI